MGLWLHRLSILLTVTILAGFTLFAVDEMDGASVESRDRVAGDATASTAPGDERQLAEERLAGDGDGRQTVAPERLRERRNGSAREWIDDAGDGLLAPFDFAQDADDVWVRHGIPALLGVALYGFGLGFAARFMRARA